MRIDKNLDAMWMPKKNPEPNRNGHIWVQVVHEIEMNISFVFHMRCDVWKLQRNKWMKYWIFNRMRAHATFEAEKQKQMKNHKYYATCDDYKFNCILMMAFWFGCFCFISLSLSSQQCSFFMFLMSRSRCETIEIYRVISAAVQWNLHNVVLHHTHTHTRTRIEWHCPSP